MRSVPFRAGWTIINYRTRSLSETAWTFTQAVDSSPRSRAIYMLTAQEPPQLRREVPLLDTAASAAISQTSLNWLLIVGSALATFVGSVMADDQNERLKNGAFGAVAGTSIGGLAGLMKNQPDLVILGFFGSVVGATLGWVVYFAISFLARNPKFRPALDFMTGGLKAVKESLDIDSPARLLDRKSTR